MLATMDALCNDLNTELSLNESCTRAHKPIDNCLILDAEPGRYRGIAALPGAGILHTGPWFRWCLGITLLQ